MQKITPFSLLIAALILALAFGASILPTQAQDDDTTMTLADFEDGIMQVKDEYGNNLGFVPWGDVEGNVALSTVTIEAGDALALPDQAAANTILQIDYDITAWGGFSHVLTDDGETWLAADWTAYNALSFWLYGNNTGGTVRVDIFDNRAAGSLGDTAERWFYRIPDDYEGWQHFVLPFAEFQRRSDWQPDGAPNDGLGLDQVSGYAFDFPAGMGAQVAYIDEVQITVADSTEPVDEDTADMAAPQAEGNMLVLEDFEDGISQSQDEYGNNLGFVAWGDVEGNVTIDTLTVEADDALALPDQAAANTVLQVDYDIAAWGGFSHVLTDDGETWLAADWTAYDALSFWLYGNNTGGTVRVDIFDNRAAGSLGDTAERWFYRITDDYEGWQQFTIPFAEFQRRTDWQPDGAPFDDFGLDAVSGYAFDFPAGMGAQTAYIDDVQITTIADAEPADSDATDTAATFPDYNSEGEWELLWSDEFDAEAGAPINDEYWNCMVGGHGWGNNEFQYYTRRPENVAHNGEGQLVITAIEETLDDSTCWYGECRYTSARCTTERKVAFTFGRVEARLDLPFGQGIWPAFWMLGTDVNAVGWPQSGEIDIMEYIGRNPRTTYGTIHGPEYSGGAGIGSPRYFSEPVADNFHVFAIEWEPDVIRWYVDGEEFFTVPASRVGEREWVFNHDFFILLNLAVGGNWPGPPNDSTPFPQEFIIDYVRVYQRASE